MLPSITIHDGPPREDSMNDQHFQRASYNRRPADGEFRTTHIAVRDDSRWLLAGIHLSPIGGPPPFARPAEPGAREVTPPTGVAGR
jgi:hypothetical protein